MGKKSDIMIIRDKGSAIVTFTTETISNAERIMTASEEINAFVEEHHPEKVIFDFAKVKFFSSLVLGMILGVRAKLEADNGEVLISSIDPQLYRVFKITNLDKIFRFFPDAKSALESVNKG